MSLKNLKQESYIVKAAKQLNSRFGISYKLLIAGEGEEHEEDVFVTWANKSLTNTFIQLEEESVVNKDGDFLSLHNQPLGGVAYTRKGNKQTNMVMSPYIVPSMLVIMLLKKIDLSL